MANHLDERDAIGNPPEDTVKLSKANQAIKGHGQAERGKRWDQRLRLPSPLCS